MKTLMYSVTCVGRCPKCRSRRLTQAMICIRELSLTSSSPCRGKSDIISEKWGGDDNTFVARTGSLMQKLITSHDQRRGDRL